jgi:hypothetical protein
MSGQAALGPGSPEAVPPAPRERRRGDRRVRLAGALTGALAVVLVTALVLWLVQRPDGDAKPAAAVPAAWARPVVSPAGLAERSGVKLTQVAVTGDGGLVDLRYQVVDPDKAASLHDQRTPSALVDEATGLVVNQLLMDHAHHGAYKVGVRYYLVFNNFGNWVHRGGRVTVLLGDAQVEHVVVR